MKDPTFPSSSHNCQPKLTINFITNITNSIYAKATLTGFGASSWPETEDGQPIIPAKLQVEFMMIATLMVMLMIIAPVMMITFFNDNKNVTFDDDDNKNIHGRLYATTCEIVV